MELADDSHPLIFIRLDEERSCRAPDGPGWAGKSQPTGRFVFYQPSPPWAGPKFSSPAHALGHTGQPMGAHGLAS